MRPQSRNAFICYNISNKFPFARSFFSVLLCFLIANTILMQSVSAQNGVKANTAADIRVVFLGAENGYAVGSQHVRMLCVIKNEGSTSLPEKRVRLRCYTLAGLDYLDGELWPYLPALAPGQSVSIRWNLAPTDKSGLLAMAVLIDTPDKPLAGENQISFKGPRTTELSGAREVNLSIPPQAVMVSIPHLTSEPHMLSGISASNPTPHASVSGSRAWLGNDRVGIQILASNNRQPLLALAGRQGAEWKLAATASSLFQVRYGEDGQNPWWASFRWRSSQVRESKDVASLTLTGTVGEGINAEYTLEAHRDTGAIEGRLRITPLKNLRCFSVELPRLLAETNGRAFAPKADGLPRLLPDETQPLSEEERIAAIHNEATTFGLTWTGNSPLSGWKSTHLPTGDWEHAPLLGGRWNSEEQGDILLAGATVEFRFRLFVISPSETVRDALRFLQP